MPITALTTALKGLLAHQGALNTTANNIANADTEGYTTQTVQFVPSPSIRSGSSAHLIGTGVSIGAIRRMRDTFLDAQFWTENQRASQAQATVQAFDLIQSIIDDPGANGINASLTEFFNAVRDMGLAPENPATRTAVSEIADNLAFIIRRTYDGLKTLQSNLDTKVGILVSDVNSLASQIADMNGQILRAQSGGTAPNDLIDRRDLLIDKLSRIMPVIVTQSTQAASIVNVSVAGVSVVSGTTQIELDTQLNATTNFKEAIVKGDTTPLVINGGELGGVLAARDTEVTAVISDLNAMSEALIREATRIHRGGFGLEAAGVGNIPSVASTLGTTGVYSIVDDGFGNLSATYTPTGGTAGPAVTGTIAASGTNSTLIPGLTLTAGSTLAAGTMTITVNESYVLAGTGSLTVATAANGVYKLTTNATANTVDITFTPTGGTESAAVTKSVTAATAHTGLITGLTITTGATLTDGVDYLTTGNNLFTPSTSGQDAARSLQVMSSIKQDVNLLAASSAYNEPGNTATAVLLGQLQDLSVTSLGQSTISEFYQASIATLGVRAKQQRSLSENQASLLNHLEASRSSVSGVSLDEETANLIRFQRSFQASARVLTAVDEMLDRLINGMGVVGR